MANDKNGGRKPKTEGPVQKHNPEEPAAIVRETIEIKSEPAPKPAKVAASDPIVVVLIGKPGPQKDAARDLWQKHFKEPFQILYLESATCKDIKGLIEEGALGQKFILASECALAVNDFGLAEVRFPKQTADGRRDTGLPVFLYSAKSEEILVGLDPQAPVSVLIESYCRGVSTPPLTLDLMTDNLKCGIYRSNPRMEIVENAFKTKVWLHVIGEGWTPTIAKIISDHVRDNG